MRRQPLARRLWASVLVPLVGWASLGASAQLFRCRSDGVARRSCCCPAESEAPDLATVRPRSCCDVETVHAALEPSGTPNPSFAPPPVADPTTALPVAIAVPARPAGELDLGRTHGPPLVLLKHALLI